MDLDVSVVWLHSQATLVLRERSQWQTLKEGDFLSILADGSVFDKLLDAHDLVVVGLLFGDHLSHVSA